MQVPSIETDKVIMDPVYGYIHLTRTEYDVLQLPVMNRLHRISQMSTAYLTFPGALTSRFSHVVGAMNIGYKMIRHIFETLPPSMFAELFPTYTDTPASEVIESVRLACLFHDIGHGPFSHATEPIMAKSLSETEKKEATTAFDAESIDELAIHEYYSYKLVLSSEIKDILESRGGSLFQNVLSLLCKVPRNDASIAKNERARGILRKLVSSQIDADRMDYLVRDSAMSGAPYGRIDVDRVVNNLLLRKDGTDYKLAFHERALGSIEDMLDARFKMYKWVYHHHSVAISNELLVHIIEQLLKDSHLKHEDFSWQRFKLGQTDDHFVFSRIVEQVNSDSTEYRPYRGLDRRYFPVSILKRPGDYGELARKIQDTMRRREPGNAIATRIKKPFIDESSRQALQEAYQQSSSPLNEIVMLGAYLPRTPYEPFRKPEDTIWILRADGVLWEITEASPYFKVVNEEWKSYPPVHICYVLPEHRKNESKNYKDQVVKLFVSYLASISE